jgi:hypothetical protein
MSTFEEKFRKTFRRTPTNEEVNALIDQSVTSYNQSGGITAHTVNIGPQKRKLNSALQQQLLSLPKTRPITIIAMMGNSESMDFAIEIHEFMQSAGMPMAESGISQGMFAGVVKGLNFDATSAQITVGANETD